MGERFQVVSTYHDDGGPMRIVECTVHGRELAEKAAQRVREFRADQTQGPVVTVELIEPDVPRTEPQEEN